MNNQIFLKLKFFLIGDIADEIKLMIKEGGGKIDHYLCEMVNYVLAEDDTSDDYSEAIDLFQIPVITSNWIKKSYKCGIQLPVERFSPDSKQLFNGIRISPYKISRTDSLSIWALVSGNGGHCQTKLDSKITHLVTTVTEGVKHDYIKRHNLSVKIVTPDWFEVCMKDKKLIDELAFHPSYLCERKDVPAIVENHDVVLSESSLDTPKQVIEEKPKKNIPKYIHNLLLDADITAIPEPIVKRPAFEYKEPKPKVRKITKAPIVKPLATTGPLKMPQQQRITQNLPKPRLSFDKHPPPHIPKMKQLPPPPAPITKILVGASPVVSKPPPVVGIIDAMPTFNGSLLAGQKLDEKPDPFLSKFCMAGCVFLITDYETHVDKASLNIWKQVIKNNGGLYSESYTNSVTHLLCESLTSNLAKAALKSGKRLVTAHWLNDCLTIKLMKRPWLITHLPVAFPLNKRPCTNQIITISNFEGLERQHVKYLIMSTGAKYTNYLTKAHSLLISKKPSGAKYTSALQWNIPIANVEFLAQLVFGQNPEKVLCVPLNELYTQDLNKDVSILRSHKCHNILEAWNVSVCVTEEYQNTINAMMSDKMEIPKSPKNEIVELPFNKNKNSKYKILITGVANIHKYNKIVYDLGGICLKVAHSDDATVSHLVANKVLMTEKFLSAFSRTKFVITTDWLICSQAEGKFIDEARFILKDEKAEFKFNFNMLESILLSSKKAVFEGITFYLSPCLQSCRTSLTDMIKSGQGKVISKQPNSAQLNHSNNMIFIISEDVDMYLFRNNKIRQVVYSSDLILYSILQQRIDLPKHKLHF